MKTHQSVQGSLKGSLKKAVKATRALAEVVEDIDNLVIISISPLFGTF